MHQNRFPLVLCPRPRWGSLQLTTGNGEGGEWEKRGEKMRARRRETPSRTVWLITPPDPIGPNRTSPHSTSYFLPPTPQQSLILSLTYTMQTCLIIAIQEKLPTSIQLWRTCFKSYSLLISKVCADCAELRYSEQLCRELTSLECT